MPAEIDAVEFHPHNSDRFSVSGLWIAEDQPNVPVVPEFLSYVDNFGVFDPFMLQTLNWMLDFGSRFNRVVRGDFQQAVSDRTIWAWEKTFLLQLQNDGEKDGLSKEEILLRKKRVFKAAYSAQQEHLSSKGKSAESGTR